MITDIVRHMSPNAMVVFVPSFGQEILQEDVIIAEHIEEEEDIASIDITRTVKNSPSTFNITIRDPKNKFILPDDPDTEISTLKSTSQRKTYTSRRKPLLDEYHEKIKKLQEQILKASQEGSTSTGSVIGNPPQLRYVRKDFKSYHGEFYKWSTYDDWANDYYIVLEDITSHERYPTQVLRDNDGTIKERWAFDSIGNIIYVSLKDNKKFPNVGDEDALLASFPDDTGTIVKKFTVSEYYTKKTPTKEFIVHKHYNKDLVDGIYRDYDEQGIVGEYKKGRCKISPMHRLIIFMSPRFNSSGEFNQTNDTPLIPVFTGVVNTVQQGYSNGEHIITVQGEDVTKYMRLSIINVNPALSLNNKIVAGQYGDERINVWATILKGLTTPEIIRLVCLGTDALRNKGAALNQKIDAIGYYKLSRKWSEGESLEYDPTTQEYISVRGNKKVKVPRADFRKMLGYLFSEHSVHIYDPFRDGDLELQGWRPYALSMKNNWSFYQADFKTRREIAYKSAEDSFFNFYADGKGHIWFHPYRFDISWILGAENPKVYIIDNPSIISFGFIEDDSELYTEVQVTTEPDFGMSSLTALGYYTGVFRDEGAMLKYGQRIFVGVNPIVNTKTVNRPGSVSADIMLTDNREAAANSVRIFAKSLLKRLLASKYQGQITIVGRPELEPGRPIYVPIRNMIYYVETVDHNISFGGNFTTTLHLSYGRKPWELLPEMLTFSDSDEIYMTDASIFDKKKTQENSGDN